MTSLSIRALAVLALLATACGSDLQPKGKNVGVDVMNNATSPDANGMDAGGSPDMSETVPDATMSSQDAPTILELRVSPPSISSGETTLVSAVVTDPQGTEDIVAGSLLDSQTQQFLANFTLIGGGAYEAEVSWDQLDQIRSITFGPGGAQRSVTAEFIDLGNERSTRSTTIMLTCVGEPACDGNCGFSECGGSCVDAAEAFQSDDDNCGSCGNACDTSQACEAGSCVTPEPSAVGQACTDAAECGENLLCLTEEEFGIFIPDGYCSNVCGENALCGAGATCVNFDLEGNAIPLCGKVCDDVSDCRAGYDCLELETVEGGFETVCAF